MHGDNDGTDLYPLSVPVDRIFDTGGGRGSEGHGRTPVLADVLLTMRYEGHRNQALKLFGGLQDYTIVTGLSLMYLFSFFSHIGYAGSQFLDEHRAVFRLWCGCCHYLALKAKQKLLSRG